MSGEEKTEDPTERKMTKAREEGQTLTVATGNKMISFFFGLVAVALMLPGTARYVAGSFDVLGRDPAALAQSTEGLIADFMVAFIRVVATLLAVIVVSTTLFSAIVKKGLTFSLVPVQVKLSRVNPGQNLTNMLKPAEIKSVLFDLLKLLAWFGVLFGTMLALLPELIAGLRFDYDRTYGLILYLLLLLGGMLLGAGVVFAAFDFIMERKAFIDTLKMTKSEVKRERKDQQGDPKIKAWRNEMGQALMRNTPRGAEHATVVVEGGGSTVSVRFDQAQLEVPFIVDATNERGKGRRARRKADRAGAVLIQDPRLARRLAARGTGDLLTEEADYRPVIAAMYGEAKR